MVLSQLDLKKTKQNKKSFQVIKKILAFYGTHIHNSLDFQSNDMIAFNSYSAFIYKDFENQPRFSVFRQVSLKPSEPCD